MLIWIGDAFSIGLPLRDEGAEGRRVCLRVRVIDEKHADAAAARFAKEATGLYDQSKVRQIGRFLKADYVLSGQVSHTGDAFTMTVHVTNVETSELEMAEDVDFRDVGKMRVAKSMDKPVGITGFDAAAIESVKQWRFEPGTKDGVAAPVVVRLQIEFRHRF